jgi:hypothetical protein
MLLTRVKERRASAQSGDGKGLRTELSLVSKEEMAIARPDDPVRAWGRVRLKYVMSKINGRGLRTIYDETSGSDGG